MLVVMQSQATSGKVMRIAEVIRRMGLTPHPLRGTGKRASVPPMALASGADGLPLEVHPDPNHAISDGAQSLDFAAFDHLLEPLRRLAESLGRPIR